MQMPAHLLGWSGTIHLLDQGRTFNQTLSLMALNIETLYVNLGLSSPLPPPLLPDLYLAATL